MDENIAKLEDYKFLQPVSMIEGVDPVVGSQFGYFTVLKKAGKNRSYQQRYQVRCECCKQVFIRTLNKIKEAEGKTECRHTKRTTKPAAPPHPCALCGQITTNLKYCSNSCKTTDINIRTKTKPAKHCLLCGKPTPNRNCNLCSPECRRLHRLKKMYGFEVDHLIKGGENYGG